jgi:hypothetical protein
MDDLAILLLCGECDFKVSSYEKQRTALILRISS